MNRSSTPVSPRQAWRRARVVVPVLALSLVAAGCGGSSRSDEEFANSAGDTQPQATTELPDAAATTGAEVPAVTEDTTVPAPAAPGDVTTGTAPDPAAKAKPDAKKPGAGDAEKPSGGGKEAPVAAAGADSATPWKNCTKPTGSPVRLGNVGNYAGVMGDDFAPGLQALQVFVKKMNDCNGLNGHPVELFTGDDQGDPALALTLAKDMVTNKKVIAFVSNFLFLSWSGIVDYLDKAGIPMIGGDAYTDIWYEKAMAFPTHSKIQTQIAAVVRASTPKGQPFNGATIYCSEQPVCESYAKAGAKAMQDNGGKIVAEQSVSLTQPSYIAQCNTQKQTKAEYVVSALVPQNVERWARNCESIDYKPKRLTLALGAKDSHKSVPNLDEMIIGLGEFSWTNKDLPGTKAFHEAIAKYNPRIVLAGSSSIAWVAGLVLLEAGKALGATATTADLLKGMYAIKNNDFGGLAPKLSYTAGVRGDDKFPPCAFLMQIKGGQWLTTAGGKCV